MKKNTALALTAAFLLLIAVLLPSCSDPTATDLADPSADQADLPVYAENITLPSQEVRVISINLAYSDENMEARGEIMMPLLLSYEPDSIGTQENGGYTRWLEYFSTMLPNYGRVGLVSSGDPDTTEHQSGNHIFYNADRYRCLDWDTVWLSHTPNFISSYQHSMLRTCTWAILEDISTGFKYVHMNCHLGFENDEINLFQVKLLQRMMLSFHELGLPVFLTGDFNTSEGSGSYQQLVSSELIADSKYSAESTMSGGTFRGWEDKDLSSRQPIDFCFLTDSVMDVHEYEIIDTFVDGVALSDHCGIFVRATVDSLPDPYTSRVKPSVNGISLSEAYRGAYLYEISFTQAEPLHLIDGYFVELFDSSGNMIYEHFVPSRHLDESVPLSRSCTFTCLAPASDYTLQLYAVDLLGARSEPILYSFTTAEAEQ